MRELNFVKAMAGWRSSPRHLKLNVVEIKGGKNH